MRTPVVFLHPLGARSDFWDPVLDALGDRFETVTLDLPGHGEARLLPKHASVAWWSRAVLDEMDRRDHDEFVVVGMSLGGLIGQHLAATSPSRIMSAVLVDTVATYPQAMRDMWIDRAQASREIGTAQFVEPTLDLWFSADFRSSESEVVTHAEDVLRSTDAEGYARTCEFLATVDVSGGLQSIACPTLLVCGTDDGPAFVAAAPVLEMSINHAHLEWLRGGHAVSVERPREFAALLIDFLDVDSSDDTVKEGSHEHVSR